MGERGANSTEVMSSLPLKASALSEVIRWSIYTVGDTPLYLISIPAGFAPPGVT